MTEQWPYWVVETFNAGEWQFDSDDISYSEEACQSKFMMHHNYYADLLEDGEEPTAGKNRLRRCRIELEPIEVKP